MPEWINWRSSFASTFSSKLLKLKMNLPLDSCSVCCFLLFNDDFGYWQVIVSLLAGLRSKTGPGSSASSEASCYLMTTLQPQMTLVFISVKDSNLMVSANRNLGGSSIRAGANNLGDWSFKTFTTSCKTSFCISILVVTVATVIWKVLLSKVYCLSFFFLNYLLEQLVCGIAVSSHHREPISLTRLPRRTWCGTEMTMSMSLFLSIDFHFLQGPKALSFKNLTSESECSH